MEPFLAGLYVGRQSIPKTIVLHTVRLLQVLVSTLLADSASTQFLTK